MEIKTISFSNFQKFPELLQINSTRIGGFSSEPYNSLNMGKHSGDDPLIVNKNRAKLFNHLKISDERLVFPAQIHSARVKAVEQPGIVANCDALVTNTKDLFLTIQTADCFPVFLFDPEKEAVGIVHSGWRGTAKNIVGKAIKLMQENYNCQPENMFAGIGAGVQQSCYQVDDATAVQFDNQFLIPDGPGHFKLDVQGRIFQELREAGLSETNIEFDSTCTHCATDLYYSYRRDGKHSGRMMGIIGMRK